jgi:hypothetical protein
MLKTINGPPRNGHQANGHAGNGHVGTGRPAPPPAAAPSEKPPGNDGAATQPAPSDRAKGGKFAPGNQAGKQFAPGNKYARGNPHYRKMAELRQKLLEFVTPQRLVELVESLFNRAKAGDAACAKLLLQYALGKAPPPVDPDCQNLHEWGIVSAFPTSAAVLAAVLDAVLPGPASDLVRGKTLTNATLEKVLEKIKADARAQPLLFEEEFKAEKAARRRRAPRA